LMAEEKLSPIQAAIKSMEQVSAAVVAIVLVLCAVFVPVAFMGGIAGELYRQFAVTVAIAVVISGVVALTLTPALCAIILNPNSIHSKFFDRFNGGFTRLTNFYIKVVNSTLHHRFIGGIVFVGIVIASIFLFKYTPTSFIPSEDQGYVITAVMLPDSATISRTSKTTEAVRISIAKEPAVAYQTAINGYDLIGGGNKSNAATTFVRLKDWAERKSSLV
ncbi:MAG: Efflux pump rane transporter BepE, partial [Pseudomonadota bacterium]